MNALELHALSKSFGGVSALNQVSLSIAPGSRTAIVGPSGSGKTTLLRMIAGFEFPDSGHILMHGRPLVDDSHEVPAHQRNIGYVPQDGALFPHLSVAANIAFGLSGEREAKRQRVAELLEMVALDSAMGRRWPHELSGGQQQRVALARALAQNPAIMLLDEPFSALDTGLRSSMRKAVSQLLTGAGITTILVTHDQAEALSFADQLAVMRQGRLVQAGAPMELYRHPVDEQTALFLGDGIVLPAWVEGDMATCELGNVPVIRPRRQGAAQILLRPEQLTLSALDGGPDGSPGTIGRITEIDFGGSACMLTLELQPGSNAHGEPLGRRTLNVRNPGINVPPVGSQVRLAASGEAHVL
ncbi:ABC transporter ATP-binding protein [Pseudomonas sp. NPDC090202]|uniref:ABC transporter ATP-binding protein n=1 Tax=unclassified Pseudomonas TaxID=196821 RepID=UPI00381CDB84